MVKELDEHASKVLQHVTDFYFPKWGGTITYDGQHTFIDNPLEVYTTKEITDKLQELINQLKQ